MNPGVGAVRPSALCNLILETISPSRETLRCSHFIDGGIKRLSGLPRFTQRVTDTVQTEAQVRVQGS